MYKEDTYLTKFTHLNDIDFLLSEKERHELEERIFDDSLQYPRAVYTLYGHEFYVYRSYIINDIQQYIHLIDESDPRTQHIEMIEVSLVDRYGGNTNERICIMDSQYVKGKKCVIGKYKEMFMNEIIDHHNLCEILKIRNEHNNAYQYKCVTMTCIV